MVPTIRGVVEVVRARLIVVIDEKGGARRRRKQRSNVSRRGGEVHLTGCVDL